MKKFTAITAAVVLSAALATAVSAAESDSVILNLEEPLIQAQDTVIAPNPINLQDITKLYANPNGDAINALAPQLVHPTGQVINDWVEIYTWLGKAWIQIPDYVPDYS
ncbi:hypothetical protein [Paenibacillus fonticola]|uniref:hypothetical protein n=1 Tax=Paenibacillus fonticola TaxID=379896 RepID=UPI000365D2FB|nr:hypothetical protein [Paenibacillus fonticola]